MIYKAEDKWSQHAQHLEHRSHKYYMKIGQGVTARYFYSPQEYSAYQNGLSRGPRTTNDTQNIRVSNNNANRARHQATSRLNNTQVRRERQAASARNESRLIAKQNVRTNSRNSSDVRNLKTTNTRARRDANRAVDRLRQTQVRKEQQSATERNKRELAGKRREARKQAYVDFQRNRGKQKPAPAQRPKNDNTRIKNDTASKNRKRAAYEKAHPIQTKINQARKTANKAYKTASKTANKAYKSASKTANTAYKSAKKAYNSKQGKAIRKKAKRTAQSAYNRGSSFVKKLFKR